MSLLLDALKRAEQEKLARQGEPGAGQPEDRQPPPERPLSRSTAAFELEAIESARPSMLMPASGPAFASPPPSKVSATASAASASASASAGDRANAQAIFAAKVPRPASSAPSKAPLFVGAAVIILLVIAGGAYVWLQLNTINAPRQAPAARPAAPPAPPTSSSVIRNVTPITSMPTPAEPPAPLMPPAAPVPPPASGAAPYPRPRHEPAPAVAGRAPATNNAENAVAGLLQENAQRSTAAPPALRLAKSAEQPRIAADVSAGYDWLVRGDLQAARRSYLAALSTDPNNIDALLGLATVDARSGERPAAARSYRRVLAADPRNTAALAGLAAVSDYTQRPEALENSLQADIRSYPNSAPLRVALGNLYASQRRWTEAQSVYFEAHRLEPDNPDVLFNLAVALDNLKQHRLAAEYYGRALAQANGRVVQFDTRAAERRAADLKR